MARHDSRNLFEAFLRVARRQPTDRAVVSGGTGLSCAELRQQVERLSGTLQEAGIVPGARVAVVLPNSAEFVVATLAIWKMGAVVVPFHVQSHQDELERYMVDCEIDTLVAHTSSALSALLCPKSGIRAAISPPSDDGKWTWTGKPEETRRQNRKADAYLHTDPRSAALIQYSTGSTGRPKRVARSHRQLLDEFETVSSLMGITKDDRILAAVPMCHSYGFMNAMIHGFLSGATLFVLKDFVVRDTVRLIEEERITIFAGVPFMYQQLAEFNGTADFSSLRWARSTGSPLAEDTSRAIRTRFGLPIYQQYGSTETGMIALSAVASVDATPGTVGAPIPGVSLEIVDDHGKAVAPETPGNVAVRSNYAPRSYDAPTDASDSYFAAGVFYPGDQGRLTNGGQLELLGRKRRFINVAGSKVDPVEVEELVRAHPSVEDVAVVAAPDGMGGEVVKAVVVLKSPSTERAIAEHCRSRAAAIKCPRLIEFREEIPRNSMGKVLRERLSDQARAS